MMYFLSHFFSFLLQKTKEKGKLEQRLEVAIPKHWLKYETDVHNLQFFTD